MASVNIASSDNITGIRLKEQASSPTTPPSGYAQLYVNTTPAVQFEDDAGTVRTLSDTTHTHAAADITSGTLDVARIPSLPASQITSGTLDNARVNWASPSAIGATTASTLRGTTLALTSTNNMLSALIPNADNTLDLGSVANRWRELFTNEITLTQTSTATTGTFQPFTVSSTFNAATDYTQVPRSMVNTLTLGASGNQLTVDLVYGLNNHIIKSGTGSLIALRAMQSRSEYSAGAVGSHMLLTLQAQISGGQITNHYGLFVDQILSATPNVTSSVGVQIGNHGGSGIGTSWGLYIAGQSGSSVASYAIQTANGIIDLAVGSTYFRVRSSVNGNMIFVDGTNNRVGIGTSSPTRTLEVNGTIGSATTYSTTVGATNRALYVDNTGLIGYLSSRAGMKNTVVSLSTTYDTLMQQFEALNPVSFYYNNDLSGQRRFGLIAEEVDAINPHWVSYDPVLALNEETGEMYDTGELVPATVSYNDMISVLIAVVQQLNERIKVLEGA